MTPANFVEFETRMQRPAFFHARPYAVWRGTRVDDRIELTDFAPPRIAITVACSKGTYVRTVAHEVGQKVGCGAHLLTLRRLASGKFDVADAHRLEDILKWDEADLTRNVIPFLKLKQYE